MKSLTDDGFMTDGEEPIRQPICRPTRLRLRIGSGSRISSSKLFAVAKPFYRKVGIMPFKTEYGTHYHVIEGCHGADIPCDTKGLSPCTDCCSNTGGSGIPSDRGSGSATVGGSDTNEDEATERPRKTKNTERITLSQYAKRHGIQYGSAYRQFLKGKLGYKEEDGRIYVDAPVIRQSKPGNRYIRPQKSPNLTDFDDPLQKVVTPDEELEHNLERTQVGAVLLDDDDIDFEYIQMRLEAIQNSADDADSLSVTKPRRLRKTNKNSSPVETVTPDDMKSRRITRRGSLKMIRIRGPQWIRDLCVKEAQLANTNHETTRSHLMRYGLTVMDVAPDIRNHLAQERKSSPQSIKPSEIIQFIEQATEERLGEPIPDEDHQQRAKIREFIDEPLIQSDAGRYSRETRHTHPSLDADGESRTNIDWWDDSENHDGLNQYIQESKETKSSAAATLIMTGISLSNTMRTVKNHVDAERARGLSSMSEDRRRHRRNSSKSWSATDDDAIEFILEAVDAKLG